MLKKLIPDWLKYFIRKYTLKLWKYRKRNSFKELKNTKGAQRIILLGTPEYGNLGDHAIAKAELAFLDEILPNVKVIEITQENLQWDRKGIFKYITKKDLLLYTGGGFIGSMYIKSGGGCLRQVILNFPQNKILILPSSVYYEDTPLGQIELERDRLLLTERNNVNIYVRDSNSLNCCLENFKYIENILLIPDMVFYLEFEKKVINRRDVLIILREDKEKIQNVNHIELEKAILKMGYKFEYGSNRVEHDILPDERNKYIDDKLQEISRYKLVITDRLHTMIFSIITGTPCLALDNCSHKLSGVLNLIDNIDYVWLSSDKSLLNDLKQISCHLGKKYSYEKSKMLHYYNPLIEQIIKMMEMIKNEEIY